MTAVVLILATSLRHSRHYNCLTSFTIVIYASANKALPLQVPRMLLGDGRRVRPMPSNETGGAGYIGGLAHAVKGGPIAHLLYGLPACISHTRAATCGQR